MNTFDELVAATDVLCTGTEGGVRTNVLTRPKYLATAINGACELLRKLALFAHE